jgi:hypothetical protein
MVAQATIYRYGLMRRLSLLLALALLAGCGGSSSKTTVTTNGSSDGVPLGPAFPDIAGLPGAQGGPPWTAGDTQLKQRLKAIGLPALGAEGQALHIHQHLDIYVRGRHETLPANVGIDAAQQFISPLHTHDTTGVMHVESPTVESFSLGQFFAVWGVPLSATQLGALKTGGGKVLKAWVNGTAIKADPTRIVLDSHQEIVLAYGTPAQMPKKVPSSYTFPEGL